MPGDGLIFGTGTMVATVGENEYVFGELTNVSFTNSLSWKKWRGGGSRYATAARLDEVTLTGQAEFGKFDADVLSLVTGGTKDVGNKVTVTKSSLPGYCKIILTNPNDGSERKVTLLRCFFTNLGNLNFQQGEFTVPQVQFEAIADAAGNVAEFEGFTEAG